MYLVNGLVFLYTNIDYCSEIYNNICTEYSHRSSKQHTYSIYMSG